MPHWFSLLLITLALQLPGTAVLPLMDRDEPRFAGATIEMMERNTWTVPFFNDTYRFDKPPLTYWWMRLHYQVFGVHELSARLHSILSTWLISLVVFSMGKQLGGLRAAWFSALIWLTSLQVLIHGRLCVADMPMILAVTLAMRGLFALLQSTTNKSSTRRNWLLLYSALGFGFLAKGPISLLVPLLALALFRWWSRRPIDWDSLRPMLGLSLALGMVAAWGIPALMETQGQYWEVGMGEHVVKRGAEMLNGRPFIPGYYFVTFFLSFFPWSGFLPAAIPFVRTQLQKPEMLFLLAWFAAPMILFSFYATQLPHYTLPGFPAAAVITGLLLSQWQPTAQKRSRPRLLTALTLLLLTLSLGLIGFSLQASHPPLRELILLAGALLGAIAIMGLLSATALSANSRPKLLVSIACVLLAVPTHGLCLALKRHSATLAAVEVLSTPAKSLPIGWDFTEPSLVFYARSPWSFTGKPERVSQHLKKHEGANIIALEREWTLDHWIRNHRSTVPKWDQQKEIQNFLDQHPQYRGQRVSGFNAARFSWVDLLVLNPTDGQRDAPQAPEEPPRQ